MNPLTILAFAFLTLVCVCLFLDALTTRRVLDKTRHEFVLSQERNVQYIELHRSAEARALNARAELEDYLNAPARTRQRERVRFIASVLLLEAAGEGERGMRAVAAVIQNRKHAKNLGAVGVIRSPGQFSVVKGRTDGEVKAAAGLITNPTATAIAEDLALRLLIGEKVLDETRGATYFSSSRHPLILKFDEIEHTTTIGRHHFFRDTSKPKP